MMKNILLQKIPTNKVKETRDLNISNGNDAETYSASKLLAALGAEVSWGSRNEDGRKIDLIASYDHPWYDERIIFLVQVKSGKSYGVKLPNGFKLLTRAKKEAQRTSHSICIIWADRDSKDAYWAYVHPHSTNGIQLYSNNHLVSPPMRFDIARSQAKNLPRKVGGTGVIMSNKFSSLKEKREAALESYGLLKTKNLINPNVGKIEFTRVGWRHMFRKSRSAANKNSSLTVINYLHHILEDKPSSIYVTDLKITDISDYTYRRCEYVLSYEKVKLYLKQEVSEVKVVVRVIEEIRWPRNWTNHPSLTQLVERKLTFLSCYYKYLK